MIGQRSDHGNSHRTRMLYRCHDDFVCVCVCVYFCVCVRLCVFVFVFLFVCVLEECTRLCMCARHVESVEADVKVVYLLHHPAPGDDRSGVYNPET
jgi:hypothetical protein